MVLSKERILNDFSVNELRELAKLFNLCRGKAPKKEDLVECLENNLTMDIIYSIYKAPGKDIKEKARNAFYIKYVESYNRVTEELYEFLSDYLAKGILCNTGSLTEINKINENGRIILKRKPSKLWQQIATKRQLKAYRTARNNLYWIIKACEILIEKIEEEGNYIDVQNINLIDDDRIKHYLTEARKCYAIECYDATVVMLGRAAEYIIKEFLRRKNISFSERATLGYLSKIFEENFKDKSSKRILAKINEVLTLDRNVGAHDIEKERKIITKNEADHAWTAIQVIISELLGIDYIPYLE